jgi:hypothetical protein
MADAGESVGESGGVSAVCHVRFRGTGGGGAVVRADVPVLVVCGGSWGGRLSKSGSAGTTH